MKQTFTLTLTKYTPHVLETFKRACEMLGGRPDHEIELISVEEIVTGNNVFDSYKVTLLISAEDLFYLGGLYQRLEREDLERLQQHKKKVSVSLPVQFIKLCHLLDVPPKSVLESFVHDVGLSAHGSSGSDERMMAVQYFQRCGHGMHLWDYEEQQDMFAGLEWIRHQWYNFGNQREAEYQEFFDRELKEWVQKWKKALKKKQAVNDKTK